MVKGWYSKLTAEQKKTYLTTQRSKYNSLPTKEKKLRSEKRKNREQKYFNNLSPEKQEEFKHKRRLRWQKYHDNLSAQEKETRYDKTLKSNMRRYNSLTEEQRIKQLKKFSTYAKIRRQKLRELVITHYSDGTMKCCKCGFSDIRALCVDHINGGGRKHSKRLGGHLYEWIVKNNYPLGMFQILCQNCNIIKKIQNKEDVAKWRKQ